MKHKLKSIPIKDVFKRIKEEKENRLNYLKSNSKKLSELVVEEYFAVDKVVSNSYSTSVSNGMIGIGYSQDETGYGSKLTLEVLPNDLSIPVRILIFNGFSMVETGDYIRAVIPLYKEETLDGLGDIITRRDEEIFYLQRDFKEMESTIEITRYFEDKKRIRRVDRSIEYGKFID